MSWSNQNCMKLYESTVRSIYGIGMYVFMIWVLYWLDACIFRQVSKYNDILTFIREAKVSSKTLLGAGGTIC